MAEKTKTIGIIGGGQLGLMIVEQAHLLGARTLCLDPAPDAPAFALSDGHIVAAYDDAAALEELCRRSDVVTYEFENVPGSVLIPLEKKYNIPQGFRPLYDSQDRLREKDNARANGLEARSEFYAANLFEATEDSIAALGHLDKMLIDPPREGAVAVVKALGPSAPQRIVYVSCNPATLARDLAYLDQHGYHTTKVQPVDMFPHTHHVENVVKLVRR